MPARDRLDFGSAPLFALRGPNGEEWALWADGRATGFPVGTVVVNRAAPILHFLLGKSKSQARMAPTIMLKPSLRSGLGHGVAPKADASREAAGEK